jgi:adenylate kinase family enzyme
VGIFSPARTGHSATFPKAAAPRLPQAMCGNIFVDLVEVYCWPPDLRQRAGSALHGQTLIDSFDVCVVKPPLPGRTPSDMKAPERIAIVGGSGAGKTTLGKQLAKLVGGVFVEIDAIQHQPGWKKAPVEEIRTGIYAALNRQSRWVIDGTAEREVGDFIARRADLIVWLDLPLAAKLVRLLRRSWRRVRAREILWNGNVETWRDVFVGRDSVIAHPLRTHYRHRRQMLARSDQAKIVRLRSTREVDAWLSRLQKETRRMAPWSVG